jgi:hypothetical protein
MSGRSISTAAVAQLAARRSHNPGVVTLILNRRSFDILPEPTPLPHEGRFPSACRFTLTGGGFRVRMTTDGTVHVGWTKKLCRFELPNEAQVSSPFPQLLGHSVMCCRAALSTQNTYKVIATAMVSQPTNRNRWRQGCQSQSDRSDLKMIAWLVANARGPGSLEAELG